MKAVIQRVNGASVTVDGSVAGEIGKGYLILLGVMESDGESEMKKLAKKIFNLRIFEDENGKTNKSLTQVGGEILVVSQFTLCADISHGNRPSFIYSAKPETANELYEHFCAELETLGAGKVQKGIFGADMAVELINDGPFTIIADTDDL